MLIELLGYNGVSGVPLGSYFMYILQLLFFSDILHRQFLFILFSTTPTGQVKLVAKSTHLSHPTVECSHPELILCGMYQILKYSLEYLSKHAA